MKSSSYAIICIVAFIVLLLHSHNVNGSSVNNKANRIHNNNNNNKIDYNMLEEKLTIENENIRKENKRLEQFLLNSKYLEESNSNNIDITSLLEMEEQAPKLLCEEFANSAIGLCRKQYVGCIKRAAGATTKKLTARAIRRAAENSTEIVDEQDRLAQVDENPGPSYQTPLQRRENSAKHANMPKPFMTLQPNAMIPPSSMLPDINTMKNKNADPEKAIVDSTKKLANNGDITWDQKRKIDADVNKKKL